MSLVDMVCNKQSRQMSASTFFRHSRHPAPHPNPELGNLPHPTPNTEICVVLQTDCYLNIKTLNQKQPIRDSALMSAELTHRYRIFQIDSQESLEQGMNVRTKTATWGWVSDVSIFTHYKN